MSLSFKKIKNLYSALYRDRMDITSVQETEDEDGATVNGYPNEPQQKNIPCRISFPNKDTPKEKDELYNKVKINPIIFCDPEVDVKAGDKIVVRRLDELGNVYATYEGMLAISGKSNKYETHQEFQLNMDGDA
jgi:hypothetical protein